MILELPRRTALAVALANLILPALRPVPAHAMEVAEYKKLLETTVKEAVSGSIGNPDATAARLEQALKLAIDGAKAYVAKEPAHTRVFDALIGSIESLKSKKADDVEAEWGEDGRQFAAHGFDLKKNDQFSTAKSHVDVIVHPTLAIALLNEFRKSKDAALLDRMKAELVEAVEHADHLK
ncbi:MAG: hypothetical protein JNK67_24715 [Alphaproteobacteria bacterium]|nr:hypothetical protein [Alphaproteobacteria bacterium]